MEENIKENIYFDKDTYTFTATSVITQDMYHHSRLTKDQIEKFAIDELYETICRMFKEKFFIDIQVDVNPYDLSKIFKATLKVKV